MGRILGIVAVDGLDGCGKSTFVEHLVNRLAELLPPTIVPVSRHLPFYNSESGKNILEFLNDTSSKMNLDKCKDMMILNGINKSDFYCKIGSYAMELETDVILVLDRFVASNYIYSAPYFDTVDEMFDYGAQIDEFCRMPKPDVQICLFCNDELRMKRINSRGNKQIYELDEYQSNLSKNYKEVVLSLKENNIIKKAPIIIPSDIFDEEYQKENSMSIDAKEMENTAIIKCLSAINTMIKRDKRHRSMKVPRGRINYIRLLALMSMECTGKAVV